MNTSFLLALSLLAAAAPAGAETLRYVVSGQQGMIASFEIDSKPMPGLIGINDEFFKLTDVPIDYPADGTVHVADVSFYARSVGSGMAIYQVLDPTHLIALFDGYGPHLYRGSVQSPTMKTGTFDFEGGDDRLVVSAVAVPEPATWALMLAGGLGLAGWAAWRGRKTAVRPT